MITKYALGFGEMNRKPVKGRQTRPAKHKRKTNTMNTI